MKKILLIYEPTGGGHLSTAKTLEAAIQERYPDYKVVLKPLREAANSRRFDYLSESYNNLIMSDPRPLKYILKAANSVNVEEILAPFIAKAIRNLKATLLAEKPDLIVSVFGMAHYTTVKVLKEINWYGKVPYVIFCTDMTRNFLKTWASPEADLTIALLDEAKQQLLDYGVPSSKIKVLNGLPVHPKFWAPPVPEREAREKLGLDPERFTVLISMGGVAIKNTFRYAKALMTSKLPIQVVVCCGFNTKLHARLTRMTARHATVPMRILGFTDQMALLMDAADVLIAKPGPATLAEAIVKELPVILDTTQAPMPQEEGNLEFALRHQICVTVPHIQQLETILGRFMDSQHYSEAIREKMRGLKNRQALINLLETIFSHVEDRLLEAQGKLG